MGDSKKGEVDLLLELLSLLLELLSLALCLMWFLGVCCF
jgi:hypothetical protein